MKATKMMLSGLLLLLLSIYAFTMDNRSGTWLAGVALFLIPFSISLFVMGLAAKD